MELEIVLVLMGAALVLGIGIGRSRRDNVKVLRRDTLSREDGFRMGFAEAAKKWEVYFKQMIAEAERRHKGETAALVSRYAALEANLQHRKELSDKENDTLKRRVSELTAEREAVKKLEKPPSPPELEPTKEVTPEAPKPIVETTSEKVTEVELAEIPPAKLTEAVETVPRSEKFAEREKGKAEFSNALEKVAKPKPQPLLVRIPDLLLDGPLSAGQLISMTHRSKGRISQVMKRLIQLGTVVRDPDTWLYHLRGDPRPRIYPLREGDVNG